MRLTRAARIVALAVSLTVSSGARVSGATTDDALASSAPWLADRGTGMWTSIFGTYVNPRELLVMPFVEGYYDNHTEYKPAELGFGLEQDFRGKFRAVENQIFLAYGLNDALGVELEAALYTAARLEKAADDPSSMPALLEQSGFGDWQMEVNWRIAQETASRPEVFALVEVDPPSAVNQPLIGTTNWETKFGIGAIRGLRWGTVSGRIGALFGRRRLVPHGRVGR